MGTRTVWVYSEQELTPRAFDVLQTIKNESGFGDVRFQEWYPGYSGADKVLVFGNMTAPGRYNTEFVHTYSIAQMMSKPNAMTVISTSLKLYFSEPVAPPFSRPSLPLHVGLSPADCGFHYDQPVVIDIETDGNLGKTHTPEDVNIISIALYQPNRYAYLDGRAPSVVWCNGDENGTLPLAQTALDMFARELPKFTKAIYHNGKFDTRVLNRVLGVKLCVWFDTMLAHHALNHAAGMHGLKELAHRYLGAPDWEGDIKKYTKGGGHYENIPRSKIADYNGWDVYWTYKLYELLEPMIQVDENSQMAFMVEMSYADFLLEVEANGIPFDTEAAVKLSQEQEIIMVVNQAALAVLTKREGFNPNSPIQVKAWLKEQHWTVAKTDQETIEDILNRTTEDNPVHTFCELLLAYRKAAKIKSTYAEGWMKSARKGRVHPTFLVHGTTTGRLSSTSPNAQNMPRNKMIRKIVSV